MAGYSAKAARKGKDLGKKGKNFAKIAKKAGGGEKGNRIAGAILKKLRAKRKQKGTTMLNQAVEYSGQMLKFPWPVLVFLGAFVALIGLRVVWKRWKQK